MGGRGSWRGDVTRFPTTPHMKRCFHGYTGCGRTGKRVQPVGRPRPTDWFMGRLVAVGVGLNFAYCPPRPVVGAPSSSRRTRSNPPPWYPAAGGRSLMPAGWLCEWGFTPFPLLLEAAPRLRWVMVGEAATMVSAGLLNRSRGYPDTISTPKAI